MTPSWSPSPPATRWPSADVVVADRLAPRELLDELLAGRRADRRRQAAARPLGDAGGDQPGHRRPRPAPASAWCASRAATTSSSAAASRRCRPAPRPACPCTVVPGLSSRDLRPGPGRHPGDPPRRRPRVHGRLRPPAAGTPGVARRVGGAGPAARHLVLLMAVQNAGAIAAALVDGRPRRRHAGRRGRRRHHAGRAHGAVDARAPSAAGHRGAGRRAPGDHRHRRGGRRRAPRSGYALSAMAELLADRPTPPTRGSPTTATCATSSCASTSRPSTGCSSPRARRSSAGRSRRAIEPRSFLMAERWLDGLADVLGSTDAPCFVVERGARRAGHRLPRAPRRARLAGAPAAALARSRCCEDARSVVVLEDIVDHTNVGAIFRSGAGARRSTRFCSRRGAPTRSTAARSRSRWVRCSRCRGPASTTGTTRCRPSRAPASPPSR